MNTLVITNISAEDMGEFHLIEVRYIGENGAEQSHYMNLDGTGTDDENTDLNEAIKNSLTDENQKEFNQVVQDCIHEKVLGFIPMEQDSGCLGDSIFGCSLADYGVYRYKSKNGEYAVVVHKYYESISYNDTSKRFNNIDELDVWYGEMMQDDQYNDASAVKRAIDDIEGYN